MTDTGGADKTPAEQYMSNARVLIEHLESIAERADKQAENLTLALKMAIADAEALKRDAAGLVTLLKLKFRVCAVTGCFASTTAADAIPGIGDQCESHRWDGDLDDVYEMDNR